ncbi:T. brucei spp.-specific protein [Trypanosoma brucei gambiense DAL972]|uniref:Uncharacterized protein n=1 Tax=Trypanosoma brucei gambiense (strain MHOM/CI/86/DAL972) TaxID=679716 RepID=D0A2G6_TRYB9|nr:T. brucei spp.-specific protein [Trypanosoma brucei gambiense DAL972]CBH15460.1 T. brucei spp.-specific protein [Trypanosoma brucei gambiense DAL972]|eukprot:XP_011777724.1 T. brucei spp.-specific protein [Trypanosoma brucei gambiense DAL972]
MQGMIQNKKNKEGKEGSFFFVFFSFLFFPHWRGGGDDGGGRLAKYACGATRWTAGFGRLPYFYTHSLLYFFFFCFLLAFFFLRFTCVMLFSLLLLLLLLSFLFGCLSLSYLLNDTSLFDLCVVHLFCVCFVFVFIRINILLPTFFLLFRFAVWLRGDLVFVFFVCFSFVFSFLFCLFFFSPFPTVGIDACGFCVRASTAGLCESAFSLFALLTYICASPSPPLPSFFFFFSFSFPSFCLCFVCT